MPTKRTYSDSCAGAHALDLVGERWALLVVRELVLGPKRFTDLRAGLPGISPNVLTQRLTELEQASVLTRRKLPPPAGTWVYELTAWGRELEPVIMALGRWGARSPELPREAPLSIDSLVLSFRTMFDAARADGLDARYELRLGEHRFRAEVRDGRLAIERGEQPDADAGLEAEPLVFAQLAYDGGDFADAVRTGALVVRGNKTLAKRFFKLYSLPEAAPATWVDPA